MEAESAKRESLMYFINHRALASLEGLFGCHMDDPKSSCAPGLDRPGRECSNITIRPSDCPAVSLRPSSTIHAWTKRERIQKHSRHPAPGRGTDRLEPGRAWLTDEILCPVHVALPGTRPRRAEPCRSLAPATPGRRGHADREAGTDCRLSGRLLPECRPQYHLGCPARGSEPSWAMDCLLWPRPAQGPRLFDQAPLCPVGRSQAVTKPSPPRG